MIFVRSCLFWIAHSMSFFCTNFGNFLCDISREKRSCISVRVLLLGMEKAYDLMLFFVCDFQCSNLWAWKIRGNIIHLSRLVNSVPVWFQLRFSLLQDVLFGTMNSPCSSIAVPICKIEKCWTQLVRRRLPKFQLINQREDFSFEFFLGVSWR
jgi:hypothetical protein